jgi:hypothetical protein
MCSPGVTAQDRVLAELAALDPRSLDARGLIGEIRDLARFIDRAQGDLARLAGALDASGGAEEAGYGSTAAFLRHGCGRSAARAGELVATGRGLRRLEPTGKALAAGEISFDAAHVICRTAAQIDDAAKAAFAEQQLLDAAGAGRGGPERSEGPDGSDPAGSPDAGPEQSDSPAPASLEVTGGLDPGQLRHLGEELTYRADPDAVEERQRKRFERRHLSFGLTMDDTGTISGACGDGLSLEIIKTAADAFSPPGGAGDTRTAAQRRMDGLTAACQAALDSGTAATRHGAAPHLSILTDEATLSGDEGAPPASTGYGTRLTARQVMALACRAEISLIRCRDGVPLDVGRMQRTETPGIRRALHARDRGCRWPGCGIPAAWCTAHHIRPWAKGGRTSRKTMILLCFVHHQYFIHYLGWTLTGDPDGTVALTHPGGWLTLTSPLPAASRPRAP